MHKRTFFAETAKSLTLSGIVLSSFRDFSYRGSLQVCVGVKRTVFYLRRTAVMALLIAHGLNSA
eukprot:scaffold16406_cov161-Skeletonema_menzelii.AAC.2